MDDLDSRFPRSEVHVVSQSSPARRVAATHTVGYNNGYTSSADDEPHSSLITHDSTQNSRADGSSFDFDVFSPPIRRETPGITGKRVADVSDPDEPCPKDPRLIPENSSQHQFVESTDLPNEAHLPSQNSWHTPTSEASGEEVDEPFLGWDSCEYRQDSPKASPVNPNLANLQPADDGPSELLGEFKYRIVNPRKIHPTPRRISTGVKFTS